MGEWLVVICFPVCWPAWLSSHSVLSHHNEWVPLLLSLTHNSIIYLSFPKIFIFNPGLLLHSTLPISLIDLVCLLCVCVYTESIRGHQSPWSWSYQWFETPMWVLRTELWSFEQQQISFTLKPSLQDVYNFCYKFYTKISYLQTVLCGWRCGS